MTYNRLGMAALAAVVGLAVEWAGAQTTWLVSNDPAENPDFAHPRQALLSPLVVSGDTVEVSAGLGAYEIDQIFEPIDFGVKNVVLRNEAGEMPVFRLTFCDWPATVAIMWIRGGQGPQTVVEGFRFENDACGQDIVVIEGSSPTIRRCTFDSVGDRSSVIGAYGAGAAPTIEDCVFFDNYSAFGSTVYSGGDSITIRGCRFQDSLTSGSALMIRSGGTVTDCECLGNESYDGLGGDITVDSRSPGVTVERCRFAATRGGWGFRAEAPVTVVNCIFDGSFLNGGYVFAAGGPAPYFASFINCTFARSSVGRVFVSSDVAAVFARGCVVWGNTISGPVLDGVGSIGYSLVQGGLPGTGNINSDPKFRNAVASDYRLLAGSPAIDAADNTAFPAGVATDFDGLPRFVDDPNMPNTGNGTPPLADMGAHEYQDTLCQPDLTTTANPFQPGFGVPNGVVNNDDFFYYLLLFSAADPRADMTTSAIVGSPGYGVPNGVLNNDDFFYYLTLFATGC